ncbi:MAG: hypothetical protein MUF64_02910 [Polyangiaceae bacterium]|jgi:hypothetical protein|nr:hypothetical protein [Polyangiaceae bacterium]
MNKMFLLVAVLGGCMMGSSDGMHDGTADMQSALSSMRDENERHKGATEATQTLDEYRAEAQQHRSKMGSHMDHMRGGMAGMNCQPGQDGRSMSDAMSSMQADLDMHGKEMDAAGSLDEGRSHCGAHYTKLRSDLDGMSAAMGHCSMMGK